MPKFTTRMKIKHTISNDIPWKYHVSSKVLGMIYLNLPWYVVVIFIVGNKYLNTDVNNHININSSITMDAAQHLHFVTRKHSLETLDSV